MLPPLMRGFMFLPVLLAIPVATPAADLAALVRSCESCHGKDGISTDPTVPIIAGFSYEGFLSTMREFREGERVALEFRKPGEPETAMNDIATALSDEEVRGLADHFSKLEFRAPAQPVDPDLARRGAAIHAKLCEKCHTDGGAHPVEDAAILAGQWTPYLRRQFANVIEGKRVVPQVMQRRIAGLGSANLEALLNFYASQASADARAE